MRRRRSKKSGTHDSFDLFLDTITNTFGGVLLIALLLVLLIRETSEVATESVQTESRTSIQQKIDLLQAEKLNLEQAEQIRRDMAQNLDSGDTKELASLLAELSERNEQLKQQQNEEAENVETLQGQIRDTKTRAAQLEQELADQQEKLKSLSADLDEAVKLKTRTMPTPKEKLTLKFPSFVMLKNNRLYILDKTRGYGAGEVDSNFFTPTSTKPDLIASDNKSYKLRKDDGIPLGHPKLAEQFRRFDPGCYIAFAVYPDSFDEFANVRAACVEADREMRIVPWENGKPVTIVKGNSRGKAQ